MRKVNERRGGFTLIELLVVVSVMLVLMGLILAGASGLRRSAQKEATNAVLQQLAMALDQYQNDYRSYPTLNPSSLASLSSDATFNNLYWDSGKAAWKREAFNACVVFQLLVKRGKGPYLDAGAKFLRYPKDASNNAVKMTIEKQEVRVAVDNYDGPIYITWQGVLRLARTSVTYNGYFYPVGDSYVLTTADTTQTIANSDVASGSAGFQITGLRLWSSGADRKVDTHDDVPAVITGR